MPKPKPKAPLVAVSDTRMKGSGDDTFSLSLFSSCSALLEKLISHHHGWLFNEPVDVKKLRLKDYYAVIRHPMDLGTVKCRVHKGRYNSPLQFADDVRLTFRNAMVYNRKDETAYAMAEELLGIFESEWPSIEAQFSDGKIEKEIDSVKKQGFSCKVEVIEEECEIKPCKIARKASSGKVILSKKLGPCGGTGGSAKDMDITGITRIVKVSVRHAWVIDALTVHFLRNGKEESTDQWGGGGGSLSEFTLQPSEYITSVKGHMGSFFGYFVVRSLKFETNFGSYGPYGKEQGTPFELSAINGKVIGFHGRSATWLDTLGVYVDMEMDPVERLITGFKQFKTEVYDKKPNVFGPLKNREGPKFMLFACSDSRACPSITLGFQSGEAFTVRNIANMVPSFDKNKYTSEGFAIEYAVLHLKVENIVVIGHSKCDGIKKLMTIKYDGNNSPENLYWAKIVPARIKVKAEHGTMSLDDQCAICEKEAVKVSIENLKTYPFVMEQWKKGKLKLFGAHYDFVNGTFEIIK